MTKRTYEKDARKVDLAGDFEMLVKDKREGWRANNKKSKTKTKKI